MPGDQWSKAANAARAARVHVGAPRQAAAVHGRRVRPGPGVVRGAVAGLGAAGGPAARRHARRLVGDLNRVYRDTPALYTQDTTPRASPGSTPTTPPATCLLPALGGRRRPPVLACVANFSGGPHEGYRLGLPFAGRWREVLNTDAEVYGGSGVGNLGSSRPSRSAGTAGPPRPRCACRRSACCGWPPSGLCRMRSGPSRRRTSGRPPRWRRSPRRSWATRPRRSRCPTPPPG